MITFLVKQLPILFLLMIILQQCLLLQELQDLLHTYRLKNAKNNYNTFFGTDFPLQ